jgi:hypothetical protein
MGCGVEEGGEGAGGANEVSGGTFPLGGGGLAHPAKHTRRIRSASRRQEERLVICTQGTIEHQEAKNMPLSLAEQMFKTLRDLSVKRIFLIVPTVPLCGEGRDEGVAGRGPVRDKYKVCNMFNIS